MSKLLDTLDNTHRIEPIHASEEELQFLQNFSEKLNLVTSMLYQLMPRISEIGNETENVNNIHFTSHGFLEDGDESYFLAPLFPDCIIDQNTRNIKIRDLYFEYVETEQFRDALKAAVIESTIQGADTIDISCYATKESDTTIQLNFAFRAITSYNRT